MSTIRYRAFLAGNCEFPADPHNLPRLKGPRNDLQLLGRTLTDETLGLHRREDVVDLLDASKDTVMHELDGFLRAAEPEDQILFYYSGHGWLDAFNRLFLCFRDTQTDELARTAIPDVLLNILLDQCASRRIVVILDCCHSGRFKGGTLPDRLKGEGRYVITSSRAGQLSRDAETEDSPSAFTHYLAGSLVTREADIDSDGYVSITEAYDYVLRHLFAATKQRPQCHFDKVVGNLALGRSAFAKVPAPPLDLATEPPPLLGLSESAIEVAGARVGDPIPERTVAVFNSGGGRLDWIAECDAPWVELLPKKTYFKVRLAPGPGEHEAVIVVRDCGPGGARTIDVRAAVEATEERPRLRLSEESVDFGTIRGDKPISATIELINQGGGKLEVTRVTSPAWATVRQRDLLLEIVPDTSRAGDLDGAVEIESNGGGARVSLTAHVERGPTISGLAAPRRLRRGPRRRVEVAARARGPGGARQAGLDLHQERRLLRDRAEGQRDRPGAQGEEGRALPRLDHHHQQRRRRHRRRRSQRPRDAIDRRPDHAHGHRPTGARAAVRPGALAD